MARTWTYEELSILRDLYPDNSTRHVAELLGRTYCSIAGRASIEGLKKSDNFFEKCKGGRFTGIQGYSCRFQKGHIPANKGKKMSKRQYELASRTMFKPGHLPLNTKKDGDITVRGNYKRGQKYQYIRLSMGKWKELHRYIWEQAYGSIPKGYNVIFKDRNTMNCALENLELVSNKKLMARNTIQRYPMELKQTFRTLGKLKQTIRTHEKQD